ncbi:glycoside hydrolase family 18 protein [Roseibium sp.]|uniref:glycoside hydrolase family 18 protein n=1 Tax=Roseibium sp. TaxID=1936156 RepID=UPI003262E4C3
MSVFTALAGHSVRADDICFGGPLSGNTEAQAECPGVCSNVGGSFSGAWTSDPATVVNAGCARSTSVCGCSGVPASGKINLAYYIDAPNTGDQPVIGTITSDQMTALGSSDFTHIVFGFGNICTKDTCGQYGNQPNDDPIAVWNINPAFYNGATNAGAAQAMQTLAATGKELYISVGAAWNPETWYLFGATDSTTVTAAANEFHTFFKAYGFTGIDIDFEPLTDGTGLCDSDIERCKTGMVTFITALNALATATAGDPAIKWSMAPYRTQSGDVSGTNADISSAQWQYCMFLEAKVDASKVLVNRQYYDGGSAGHTPASVVSAVKKELQAKFQCNSGGPTHQINAAQLNPLLGVNLPLAHSPNCQFPVGSIPAPCAQFASAIVKAEPNIAGVGAYDLNNDLSSVNDIATYAAQINDGLVNGAAANN